MKASSRVRALNLIVRARAVVHTGRTVQKTKCLHVLQIVNISRVRVMV